MRSIIDIELGSIGIICRRHRFLVVCLLSGSIGASSIASLGQPSIALAATSASAEPTQAKTEAEASSKSETSETSETEKESEPGEDSTDPKSSEEDDASEETEAPEELPPAVADSKIDNPESETSPEPPLTREEQLAAAGVLAPYEPKVTEDIRGEHILVELFYRLDYRFADSTESDSTGLSYGFSQQFGGGVRIPLFDNLHLRAYAGGAFQDTKVSPDSPSAQVGPYNLSGVLLGLQLGYDLPISSRFSFSTVIGLQWLQFSSAPRVGVNNPNVLVPSESGVFFEWPVGFGLHWNALPHWITVDAEIHAAAISNQSGSLFQDTRQAVGGDVEVVVPGLPSIDASVGGGIFVGFWL